MPSHLLDPFVAPLGISSLPTKQTGKKLGKGTVKPEGWFRERCLPKRSEFSRHKGRSPGHFHDSSTASHAFNKSSRKPSSRSPLGELRRLVVRAGT